MCMPNAVHKALLAKELDLCPHAIQRADTLCPTRIKKNTPEPWLWHKKGFI